MTINSESSGGPNTEPAAARAGGAVAEVAKGPEGFIIRWLIKPREFVPPPGITEHGRKTGAGRVSIVFDPDARAILATESPQELIELLRNSMEKFVLDNWGKLIGRE